MTRDKNSFLKFCGATWGHWEARFGTTFLVILALVQNLFLEFGNQHSVAYARIKDFPPSLWLAIGGAFLIWANYGAWRDENRALVALHERLKVPDLRVSIDSVWSGRRSSGPDCLLLFGGAHVENPLGPPTSLKDWEISIHVSSTNRTFKGEIVIGPVGDIRVSLPGSNTLTFRQEGNLAANSLSTPIAAGGSTSGWMQVGFLEASSDVLQGGDAKLTISVKDVVAEKQHSVTTPLDKINQGIRLPGVGLIG